MKKSKIDNELNEEINNYNFYRLGVAAGTIGDNCNEE